jgi:hypothetical protein
MSFLHDKNVYLPVIFQTLLKEGQAAPATPAKLDPIAVAKKLVNRLSRELTSAPEPINLAAPKDLDLKIDNLQSLGALLKWLSNNQVTLDGARISYTGDEQKALGEDEKNKLSPVSINESRDAVTRKWNSVDYHANLALLIKYVAYLQQKAAAMTKSNDDQGKVLEVLVGKLIDQIKAIKPDAKLDRKPKSTPENPNDIPDETPIDDFNQKLFDMKAPTKDRGSNILTAKDIKSRANLNAWLQTEPKSSVAMYDAKGTRKVLPFDDDGADHCVVVNNLYVRAKKWSELAKTPEEEKKYAFYLKKIQEIGATFTGLDGKACTITGTVSTTPGTDKPGSGKDVPKISSETINKLAALVPLNEYNINFDKIEMFFNEYSKVIANNPEDGAQASKKSIDGARIAMNDAKRETIRGNTIYSMNEDPKLYASLVQPPAINHYYQLISALDRVIVNTSTVITYFYSQYESQMTSNQRALVFSQSQGGNSMAERNRDVLEALTARKNEVLKYQ